MKGKKFVTCLILTVVLCLVLFPMSTLAQVKKGTWYCVEALYNNVEQARIEATFELIDNEYYEATFSQEGRNGDCKALYRFSATNDTFYTELPDNVPTTYGGRSRYTGDKLIYDYYLSCPESLWIKVGQTAIGGGWPAGAKKSMVLVETEGDSILHLKSHDGKTKLTYTFGAKKPPHNYVTFQVNMNVQKQLGNFKPEDGDKVVVHGDFNSWMGADDLLTETVNPGVYQYVKDFPPSLIGSRFEYLYVIVHKDDTEKAENFPPRKFTLQPGEQHLGAPYFDRKARADEVVHFPVADQMYEETAPATAYDCHKEQYLVVWVEEIDTNPDLWGRLFDKNGTALGDKFLVCSGPSSQRNPQVEYVMATKHYMVVWQDDRMGNWDIHGILLDDAGGVLPTARSLTDGSFIISDQTAHQYTPRLAYNSLDATLLCVWRDMRNAITGSYGQSLNSDIYGQRLKADGRLLLPGDTTDTKVNYAFASNLEYEELYPDVAYYGANQHVINEWMVVFTRQSYKDYGETQVWGVRIKGKNGVRLNTYGEEVTTTTARAKAQLVNLGGPPWLPEFPIAYFMAGNRLLGSFYRGSPHVESNDLTISVTLNKPNRNMAEYPLPVFMVAWTQFGANAGGDIYCQHVAYYPDSTAFTLGLKPARNADTLFTVALLDKMGQLPPDPVAWKTWDNFPVCINPYPQSYNNITYNQTDATFLIAWNDWRVTLWDGIYKTDPGWMPPPADIFGQRLCFSPTDNRLLWVEHDGSKYEGPLDNVGLAFSDADEGHNQYPALTYGYANNQFFMAYEYYVPENVLDIYGNLYNGASPFPTTVGRPAAASPASYALRQNYPNPFNPSTEIEYEIEQSGHVRLEVFNSLGQRVAVLCDKAQSPGKYQVRWGGRNAQGMPVPSGLYLYRLEINGRVMCKKMLLMR
ncbi:T9SS type A sorting domain-containing protein [candidate division KSB1 bacterium]|nr:T9SS type A sorting domain-containing protein [candidate division KSB1 bacterium]